MAIDEAPAPFDTSKRSAIRSNQRLSELPINAVGMGKTVVKIQLIERKM